MSFQMIRTCAHCGQHYSVHYRMNPTRLRQPSYCSPKCRIAESRARANANLRSRFMANVPTADENACWEWTGRRHKAGYGVLDLDGRPQLATRVMWFLTHSEWPVLNVCHACDNPPCVNPTHLWLGTDLDNARDRESKGRGRRGPPRLGREHHNCKLTPEAVINIRSSKDGNKALARLYGVTPAAIYNVRAGKAWKHV
jgi:hypothetical protein